MNIEKKSFKITWIEIASALFILCIIMVLAASAFLAGIKVQNASKSMASINSLKIAILAYNSDYGTLPIPNGANVTRGSDLFLGTPPKADPSLPPVPGTANLYLGLSGNLNPYDESPSSASVTGLNVRNTPYLSLQKNQVDHDGVGIQGSRVWYGGINTYFGIKLDANKDNTLEGLPDTNAGNFTLSIEDVASVWCNNGEPFDKPNNRWATTY